MKRNLPAILVGAAGMAGLTDAQAQQSQLSIYNLIVRDTLYQANHVYGRVITQNLNLFGGGSQVIEIGSRLGSANSDGIAPISSQSTPSLAVGGYVLTDSGDTVRLMNGSAFLDENSFWASSSSFQLQQSGSGATIQRSSPAGSSQSSTFDSVFSAVVTESSTYSALSTSSSATISTSGNRTTFTIPSSTSARRVVFNLTESQASTIFGNSNGEVQFNLNGRTVSSIDSIIVNIAGFTSGDFKNSVNFLGDITSNVALRSRVLWNFHQADEDIELDRNWYGSILAPQARLTGDSNLDGSAAVNSILFNAEMHGPTWTGVPEPSTYAAITFALGVGGWTVWRRRRPSVRS